MPFQTIKVKGGYKNKNTDTGKLYSNKPMTKVNADKQLAILKRTEKYEKKKKIKLFFWELLNLCKIRCGKCGFLRISKN